MDIALSLINKRNPKTLFEKNSKYKDPDIEIRRMWYLNNK